jgi:nucleotide-binding universal stress UspA family protein
MKIDPKGDQEFIAAIKFDDQSEQVAKSAAMLAARAGRPLRLVHVFEPSEAPLPVRERELFDSIPGEAAGIYDERSFVLTGPAGAATGRDGWPDGELEAAFEHAEAELRRLRELLPVADVPVATSVIVGVYPQALLELAASQRGALLVAGAEKTDPGLFQNRLRRTMRLMAGAAMPVLIVPDDGAGLATDSGRPLRVLVADDLSDSSRYAISNLTHMISSFHLTADILHIHVEPVNTAAMTLSPEYELEIWPGIVVQDRLINDRHEHIKTRMRNRSRTLRKVAVECGGSYHLELWHGNVSKELKRAVEVHEADISVFGKHHLLHLRPLALGQMGYKKMIGLNSAILVAPESGFESHA